MNQELSSGFTIAANAPIAVALAISALLFVIGLVGFLCRRNMIIMFLCTELMFQGAALAMIAFARLRMDVSGQVFVIFILTVAAAVMHRYNGLGCQLRSNVQYVPGL